MTKGKQLFSTVNSDNTLELSLDTVEVRTPGPDDVLVRIEAAPINPSDMFPLFGTADMRKAKHAGDGDNLKLVAPISEATMPVMHSRIDQPLPVGNECAGTVIATGDSDAAKALEGRLVSILPGAAYAEYACVPAITCLTHNDGITAREAASAFVNPLTTLGFLETMRLENHTALVHTAAASNLGQMLVRLCTNESVELVNIVRSDAQVDILRALGAKHVCDSSAADFSGQLTDAIDATGATLGFDAIGGGQMANHILICMERALSKNASGLNTYGSSEHKQVYLYGGLDLNPTTLNRGYGMSWGIGGWLMPNMLARVGIKQAAEMRQKVADEIKTTFASSYTAEISLTEMLDPAQIAEYLPKKTGTKYIVTPQKG